MKTIARIIKPRRWERNFLVDKLKKRNRGEILFPEKADFGKELQDAEIVVSNWLTKEEVALAKKLKYVIVPTSGIENIDIKSLNDRDILFYQNKEIFAETVSEYVVKNLSELGIIFTDHTIISLLGFGNVGTKIYNRLSKTLSKIYVVKKHTERVDLGEYHLDFLGSTKDIPFVLESADILINALPLTLETRGLCTKLTYTIKMGSVIVNVSRSGILNDQEILDLTKRGYFGGAIFDVYPENINERDYITQNIKLTPHIAGISGESLEKITEFVYSKLSSLNEVV